MLYRAGSNLPEFAERVPNLQESQTPITNEHNFHIKQIKKSMEIHLVVVPTAARWLAGILAGPASATPALFGSDFLHNAVTSTCVLCIATFSVFPKVDLKYQKQTPKTPPLIKTDQGQSWNTTVM